MAISFVAAEGHTHNENTAFTITKPTGTEPGDFMLCVVSAVGNGTGIPAFTISDWTLLDSLSDTAGDDGIVSVYYKRAGYSEPASWVGSRTEGGTNTGCAVVTASYRGVDAGNPIGGNSSADGLNPGTMSSGTVNNTNSGAWAIGLAGGIDDAPFGLNRSAGDPTTNRGGIQSSDGGGTGDECAMAGLWDSDGPVATGNRSFTASESTTMDWLASFVVLLNPGPSGFIEFDSSAPAAVELDTTASTATTASFTPPAGSFEIAFASARGSTTSGTPTLDSLTDSLGRTWTQLGETNNNSSAGSSNYNTTAVYYYQNFGEPAAHTVSATYSGRSGNGNFLQVLVLNGVKELVVKHAGWINSGSHPAVTITLTTEGSHLLAIAVNTAGTSWTTVYNASHDELINDFDGSALSAAVVKTISATTSSEVGGTKQIGMRTTSADGGLIVDFEVIPFDGDVITTAAAASVTANNPTVTKQSAKSASAGNATASVTANTPSTTKAAKPNAGTVTASVTANAPTVTKVSNVSASAGTVTASVTANNATTTKATRSSAGTATASGAANNATTTKATSSAAGAVTATATANGVTAAFTKAVSAGTATASGAANNATTTNTSSASAGAASASVTASGATVTSAGQTSASAGTATASAAASSPTVDLDDSLAEAGTASATAVASGPTVAFSKDAAAGTATASAVANGATTTNTTSASAGTATASGAANNVTTQSVAATDAPAGEVSASVTANGATVTSASSAAAGTATASVAAQGVRGGGMPEATGEGVAYGVTASLASSAAAGTASATAEANGAEVSFALRVDAGTATASATANDPTVDSEGVNGVFPGDTTASASANNPTVTSAASALAGTVAATAAAFSSVARNIPTIAGTVSAFNAAVATAISAAAGASSATAEANNPTVETGKAGASGLSSASAAANGATVSTSVSVAAGTATATVEAETASRSPGVRVNVIRTHPIQVLVPTHPLSKRGFSVRRISRDWS